MQLNRLLKEISAAHRLVLDNISRHRTRKGTMVVRPKHIRMSRIVARIPKSLSILESYYYSFRNARGIMDGIEVSEGGRLYQRQIESHRVHKDKAHC